MKFNFSNFDPTASSIPHHLRYPKLPGDEVFFHRARKIWPKVEHAKEIIAKKTNDEINSILKEVIRMSRTYRVSDLNKEYELDRSPVIALRRYKESNPSEKLKEKEWAEYFAILALHLLDCWITRYEEMKETLRLQRPKVFETQEKMDSKFAPDIEKAVREAEYCLELSGKAAAIAKKGRKGQREVKERFGKFYYGATLTKAEAARQFIETLSGDERKGFSENNIERTLRASLKKYKQSM